MGEIRQLNIKHEDPACWGVGVVSNDLAIFKPGVNKFQCLNQSTFPSTGPPVAICLIGHNDNPSLKPTRNILEPREEMLLRPSAWTFT